MTVRKPQVAVIGAGPAGIFAADALMRSERAAAVWLLDRLPVPFGLVRYGVAPDHPRTREVRRALERIVTDPRLRFRGNVRLGEDLTIADLDHCADAVVFATGAPQSRPLDIPGSTRQGVLAASDLIPWYCGHPDAHPAAAVEQLLTSTNQVVVIGGGNVALDIARVLTAPAARLRATDMPERVIHTLEHAPRRIVHVLVRRGPMDARFTSKELGELADIEGLQVVVDPADLVLDAGRAEADRPDTAQRNYANFRRWSETKEHGAGARIVFHFWTRPTMVRDLDGQVCGVRTHRAAVGDQQPTDSYLDCGLLVHAVGYRSPALPGISFGADDLPPHEQGRLIAPNDGARHYVAGWLKRGPSGVIGTNKADASETVQRLLADFDQKPATTTGPPTSIDEVLAARGTQVTDASGWLRVDAAERALGETRGRSRTTIESRRLLLDHAVAGQEP